VIFCDVHFDIKTADAEIMNSEFLSLRDSYLGWCSSVRHLKSDSIQSYNTAISSFIDYLKKAGLSSFAEVNCKLVCDYLADLGHQKKLKDESINNYRRYLITFFNFLVNVQFVESNPFLKSPKKLRTLTNFEWLNPTQISRLSQRRGFGKFFLRDSVILELIKNSGVRANELANIDVNEDSKVITNCDNQQILIIRLLRGNTHIVLSFLMTDLIRDYLYWRSKHYLDSKFLFVSNKGTRISRYLIYQAVRKFLEMVPLVRQKGIRVLRNTYIKNLAKLPRDVIANQKLQSFNTWKTNKALCPDLSELVAQFNKAHPKGSARF
jgi:integrase/recombinase XerD